MDEDNRRWIEDFFGDIRLVKMDVISFIERLDSKKENEPLKNKKLKFIKLSRKNHNE